MDFRQKFLLVKQSLIMIKGGAMISKYLQFVQCTTVVRVCFLGPKIWNILSDEIKQQTSLKFQKIT